MIMSLLSIDCPHCSQPVQAPAGVQTACPLCGGQVIAEEGPRPVAARGLRWWQILLIAPCVFGGVVLAVMEWSEAARSRPVRHVTPPEAGKPDAIQPAPWDGSVAEAKAEIARRVRDPGKVTYHEWKNFTNPDRHITTVDLTTINGYGGPSRQKWAFSFDRKTGELMTLLINGKDVPVK